MVGIGLSSVTERDNLIRIVEFGRTYVFGCFVVRFAIIIIVIVVIVVIAVIGVGRVNFGSFHPFILGFL